MAAGGLDAAAGGGAAAGADAAADGEAGARGPGRSRRCSRRRRTRHGRSRRNRRRRWGHRRGRAGCGRRRPWSDRRRRRFGPALEGPALGGRARPGAVSRRLRRLRGCARRLRCCGSQRPHNLPQRGNTARFTTPRLHSTDDRAPCHAVKSPMSPRSLCDPIMSVRSVSGLEPERHMTFARTPVPVPPPALTLQPPAPVQQQGLEPPLLSASRSSTPSRPEKAWQMLRNAGAALRARHPSICWMRFL